MNETPDKTLIGIDLGGSFIKGGLLDSRGRVLHRLKPQPTIDGPNARKVVHRAVGELIAEAEARGLPPVAAAGLSTCGLTDPTRGRVILSTSVPGYDGAEWFPVFAEFGLPAAVENDARCAAWAEYTTRTQPELRNWIHVTLGTSVGCGIVLDGRLWRGSTFSAGELAHISVEADGPVCVCGNRGCLESYASSQGVLDFLRRQLDAGWSEALDMQAVLRAAANGDELAREAFERQGRYLGVALTTLTHLINPQVITLGGGIIQANEAVFTAAREVVLSRALVSARRELQIIPGRLGNDAGFLGAALLALQSVAAPDG